MPAIADKKDAFHIRLEGTPGAFTSWCGLTVVMGQAGDAKPTIQISGAEVCQECIFLYCADFKANKIDIPNPMPSDLAAWDVIEPQLANPEATTSAER